MSGRACTKCSIVAFAVLLLHLGITCCNESNIDVSTLQGIRNNVLFTVAGPMPQPTSQLLLHVTKSWAAAASCCVVWWWLMRPMNAPCQLTYCLAWWKISLDSVLIWNYLSAVPPWTPRSSATILTMHQYSEYLEDGKALNVIWGLLTTLFAIIW